VRAPVTTVRYGDAWALASELRPESCDCVVTSPPYFGLRDYNHPGQFGLERTPHDYVEKLVDLFARLRPALKGGGHRVA
jgi:DNA modification methylase